MRILYTVALFVAAFSLSAQTSHTLTTQGFTFNPDNLTINLGDTIHLTLGASHTCTEVDEATWNANGTTSNGGFDYPGPVVQSFVLATPGTYWYVCQPHAGIGMKGIINVTNSTGVEEQEVISDLKLYPNPASTEVTIKLEGANTGMLSVVDVQGREVIRRPMNANGRLDVSALEPGNYNVSVLNNEGKVIARQRLSVVR